MSMKERLYAPLETNFEFRRTGNSLAESLPICQITGIITDPPLEPVISPRASRKEPNELQEFQ